MLHPTLALITVLLMLDSCFLLIIVKPTCHIFKITNKKTFYTSVSFTDNAKSVSNHSLLELLCKQEVNKRVVSDKTYAFIRPWIDSVCRDV